MTQKQKDTGGNWVAVAGLGLVVLGLVVLVGVGGGSSGGGATEVKTAPIIQPDSSRKANLAIPECPSPNGVGNSETEEERREDEEEKKQRVAYWSERAPQYWHDTSRVRVRVTTVVVAAVSVTSVKAAE